MGMEGAFVSRHVASLTSGMCCTSGRVSDSHECAVVGSPVTVVVTQSNRACRCATAHRQNCVCGCKVRTSLDVRGALLMTDGALVVLPDVVVDIILSFIPRVLGHRDPSCAEQLAN